MRVASCSMKNTQYQRGIIRACVLVLAAFGGLWGMSPCVSAQESKAGERKVFSIDGVEYVFRFCPAGEFMMGSPNSENDRSRFETQHRVTLMKGFWMLETEVTQEMWQSVMNRNPSHFKGKRFPVENVSWDDCQEFIRKLNEQTTPMQGLKFSLPTEAQWEYACRAGTTGAYGGTGNLDEMGWYEDNSGSKPHAVGTKQSNAWGLHDMHGNVWEWCSDLYSDYPSGSVTAPVGQSTSFERADRGGSWKYDARRSRSAYRGKIEPSRRNADLGFRLALVSE
ncbi:MAG: formylglycine-generating enzyme family protein [Thermoguttaceae bacterium]